MLLEDLTASILEAHQHQNIDDLLILLQQLHEVVQLPGDKSCLIGPVVKLLPSYNWEVKRRVYTVLQKLCESHSDAALLAANCVLRDTRDPNPEVKCLGVWAVSVLQPLIPLYAAETLSNTLRDPHPKVRRTAVNSCGRVFSVAPGLLEEQGFVDRLYECIRDEDPVVVVGALLVLDRVLAQEGGVVVNRKLAQYLLLRLSNFRSPQLATVLQVLRKYKPKSDPELFTQLSLLDPYLAHKDSAAVVVNCSQLFLQLISEGHPHLEKDVIIRVIPSLIEFLGSGDEHAQGYVLDFLQWTEGRNFDWLLPFSESWHLFCPPRSSENTNTTPALLHKKLLLLPRVCSTENTLDVLHTLEETPWDRSNVPLCQALLDCVVSLVIELPQPASSQALRLLVRFIESRETVVVNNALRALERLDVNRLPADEISPLLVGIVSSMDIAVDIADSSTTCAGQIQPPSLLPELLAHRAEALAPQTAAHIMQALIVSIPEFCQFKWYTFTVQILYAALKLFLRMPARFQHILGRALYICVEYEKSVDKKNTVEHLAACEIRDRALWYYNLLKKDHTGDFAKRITLSQNSFKIPTKSKDK